MRAALWFLGLFGVAVALALFASGNASTVTLYWPPHRIDLSLNLAVLLLALLFALLHLALQALSALFALPGKARNWRLAQQERLMHSALLDALSQLLAGRYVRAKKMAELLLQRAAAYRSGGDNVQLRVLAHLLVAESAQALQSRAPRDAHLREALRDSSAPSATREAVLLRAVRWSLEDRDGAQALHCLDQLPSGAARRMLALRLRLKVTRLAGLPAQALETIRLLVKHRAFSTLQATALTRAVALELLQAARDSEQIEQIWQSLEAHEKALPEVACAAAGRSLRLAGSAESALAWLLPVWERMCSQPDALSAEQRVSLIRILENAFSASAQALDARWLARVERAHLENPGDAALQYLAGVVCWQAQLWGKAQQMIRQALPRLHDSGLATRAWQVLAELAQRQGDTEQAMLAWKSAAQMTLLRQA